jgi:hypothetical protein
MVEASNGSFFMVPDFERVKKRFRRPTTHQCRTFGERKRFGGGERQLFLHSHYISRTTSISPPEAVRIFIDVHVP